MVNQPSFFFYDLETSGFDPKAQRIMQFAGQRTDVNLQPIGEPINWLVALTDEVLPDPGAILVTGITPQKTLEEGYSEVDFLKLLHQQVLTPGTTILGYNSVRFDDEFMRYTLFRNFYDPYEWQWKDERSRWDLLDLVRMTRALRPDGIEWPVDEAGKAVNKLELLASANKIEHISAHDALSDVQALIALARLIKTQQPKLFDYLLSMRSKQAVNGLINLDDPQPFVYSSGRYPKDTLHTTVAYPIAEGANPGSVLVYDLRHDPHLWLDKSAEEIKNSRFVPFEERQKPGFLPFPAKELAYNRCPAVAPIGVLDSAAQARTQIDLGQIEQNLAKLKKTDLAVRFKEAFSRGSFGKTADVDGSLYDGFINNPQDKTKMSAVRAADRSTITKIQPEFADARLNDLLLRYKARNFSQSLNGDEREVWEAYRNQRLAADLPKYMQTLQQLSSQAKTTDSHFILSELQLWAESVAPF